MLRSLSNRLHFFAVFFLLSYNCCAFAECQKLSAKDISDLINLSLENSPLIQTKINEIEIAENEVELSKSVFDPVIQSKNSSYLESYYSGNYNQIGISKRNQFLGSSIEAGFRRGGGGFPVYEDEFFTSSGGEFYSKLTIPLLRNLEVDKFRLDLNIANLKTAVNKTKLLESNQKITSNVVKVIFDLLKANTNLKIVSNLIQNLESQKKMVEESISAGTVPSNQINEVERFILKNRAAQIIYQNKVQNLLSQLNHIYLIEESLHIKECALPELKTNILFKIFEEDFYVSEAIANRPDLKIIKQIQKIIENKIEFYENQKLPEVDLSVGYENGVGSGHPSDTQDSLKAGIDFKYPIFNRKASSSLEIASLELKNRDLEIQNLLNIIKNEIVTLRNNLNASIVELKILKKEIQLVDTLLKADYENFKLGNLDLFQINQRENILINLRVKANEFFYSALKTKLTLVIFANITEELYPTIENHF